MTFDHIIRHLLLDEAGFTTNSNDAGNWTGGRVGVGELRGTKYGISAGSFPDLDIAHLSEDEAVDIYRETYWEKPGLDLLPSNLRYLVFDMGVNAGVRRAVRLLQGLAGVPTDGVIGPRTAEAAKKVTPARYTDLRKLYYTLAAAKPPPADADPRLVALVRDMVGAGKATNREFLKGWLSRADRVRTISARLLTSTAVPGTAVPG